MSVELELKAQTVRDPAAGRARHGGAATTGIPHDDAGQVAQSVRDRHRNPLHRHVCARVTAGGAELHWYGPQIPAYGRAGTVSGQDAPALLQAVTGTGVAPGVPAQLAPDIVAVRRGPVWWEQGKERYLVRFAICRRHARSLLLHPAAQQPAGPGPGPGSAVRTP